MGFRFKGEIYKVGINPCVDVPERITLKMKPDRGYIPVLGEINKHKFQQTLVAVKNGPYRLYVNRFMMAGGGLNVGDMATFIIEQNQNPEVNNVPMNALLKVRLKELKLTDVFEKLIPSRRKEINRYLNSLKTEGALVRNVEKLISGLISKL
ncbi:MAG TPA: DUF1905 domain-containing protein [Saprospiraceae bacterium]|nr:DUF1905 domain-containing protein [Saprospiraceae bacterium]